MATILFEVPRYVQLRHHEDDGYIVFDWSSFSIKEPEISALHDKALEAAQRSGSLWYIADTSKVRDVLPQEVIQWWGRVGVPKLARAGVQAIVTVVPSSALASLSTRSWQAEVVSGITLLNTATLEQAITAVRRLKGAAARH